MTKPWDKYIEGEGWHAGYVAWRKWAADEDPEAKKIIDSWSPSQRLFAFEVCERALEEAEEPIAPNGEGA